MQDWDGVEETLRRCTRALQDSAQRCELSLWAAHRVIAVQRDDSVVSTAVLCRMIEMQTAMILRQGDELVDVSAVAAVGPGPGEPPAPQE